MIQLFLGPFLSAELPPPVTPRRGSAGWPYLSALISLHVSQACPAISLHFSVLRDLWGASSASLMLPCCGLQSSLNLLGWHSGSSLQFHVWNPVLPHALWGSHVVLDCHLGILQERKRKADFSDPLMSPSAWFRAVQSLGLFQSSLSLSATLSLIWTNHLRIFSGSCHLWKWVSWRLSSSWIFIRSAGNFLFFFFFCISKSIKIGCFGWLIFALWKSQSPKVFQRGNALEQNLPWKNAQSWL